MWRMRNIITHTTDRYDPWERSKRVRIGKANKLKHFRNVQDQKKNMKKSQKKGIINGPMQSILCAHAVEYI